MGDGVKVGLDALLDNIYDCKGVGEWGNNNTKNNKTYIDEPGQVQKTNYIDWTSERHPRIMV
jgi:hypothetical protein